MSEDTDLGELTAQVRGAFAELCDLLMPEQRDAMLRRDVDRSELVRLNFRPRPHDGVPLFALTRQASRAVFRLFSLALSDRGFAVLCTTMATEDVIARTSSWTKDQHRGDYWIVADEFSTSDSFLVKIEGHHVSITIAVSGAYVYVSPVFFGAFPAKVVSPEGLCVVRPLAPAAIHARRILESDPQTLVASSTPRDLLIDGIDAFPTYDTGVRVAGLSAIGQAEALKLLDGYTGLVSAKANTRHFMVRPHELRFGWFGSADPDDDHYYVLHAGPRFCIEYINQRHADATANHEHTLMRSELIDFGCAPVPRSTGNSKHG